VVPATATVGLPFSVTTTITSTATIANATVQLGFPGSLGYVNKTGQTISGSVTYTTTYTPTTTGSGIFLGSVYNSAHGNYIQASNLGTVQVGAGPGQAGCVFASAPGAVPAFCDNFSEGPQGNGSRTGDLNGVLWGVSRISGNVNLGEPNALNWVPETTPGCGTGGDVAVCNGQVKETTNDGGSVTSLGLYPKQPFDFSGRMGTVVFDVSDDSQGSHAAWPELWIADQPLPVPFVHERVFLNTPRNGMALRFAGCANDNTKVAVDSVDVTRNYITDDTFNDGQPPSTLILNQLGCVTKAAGAGLNHFEVQVSQASIDVYATDAFTGTLNLAATPLIHIANIPNANLSFTRGLVWLEDSHYNAIKGGLGTQATHTFTWDNLGFDGPVVARDLAFDVLDHGVPGGTTLNGGPSTELGWGLGTTDPGVSISVPGVTNLSVPGPTLLTFNYYEQTQGTISYNINGHGWHDIAWPFPDNNTFTWRDYAAPIDRSELVAGTNTIAWKSSNGADVANIDVILGGGQGLPNPGYTASTDLPTTASVNTPFTVTTTLHSNQPITNATVRVGFGGSLGYVTYTGQTVGDSITYTSVFTPTTTGSGILTVNVSNAAHGTYFAESNMGTVVVS
jgi:hypothetical protein